MTIVDVAGVMVGLVVVGVILAWWLLYRVFR